VRRPVPFAIMMICMAALSAGYFLEYVEHLKPCLLCVAQRGALYVIGLTATVLWLRPFQRIGRILGQCLILLASSAGIFFAGKQLYLESLPPELRPACTIPFEMLIQSHEWIDAFMQLMSGTSDCGVRQWEFLNMSLPFWSGLIFVVIAGITLITLLRAPQ
jgi:disulfide bond formation protein DsbB